MKNNLKQAIMLKIALEEQGISVNKCNIQVDHDKGLSYVNNVQLPIIFPKKWFELANDLRNCDKEYNFYFNGFVGKGSVRETLLAEFIKREDCKIVWSNDGRNVNNKQKFNLDYFVGLSKSKYGLCPHQPDWPGDIQSLWTYRYIECLMVGVIPVNFRKTPLSTTFTEDTQFEWDDDVLKIDLSTNRNVLDHNYKVALSRFTLTQEQVALINNYIN